MLQPSQEGSSAVLWPKDVYPVYQIYELAVKISHLHTACLFTYIYVGFNSHKSATVCISMQRFNNRKFLNEDDD